MQNKYTRQHQSGMKSVWAAALALFFGLGSVPAHSSLIFDIDLLDWTGTHNATIVVGGLSDNAANQQATSIVVESSSNADIVGLDFLVGGFVGAQEFALAGPITNNWSVTDGTLVPTTDFNSFHLVNIYNPFQVGVGTISFTASATNATLFTEKFPIGPSISYNSSGPFVGAASPIPEPSVLALLAAGTVAFGVRRKKVIKAKSNCR